MSRLALVSALALLLSPMAATGYLLQTATSEAWRSGLTWVHLGTSAAFLCGYALHLALLRLPKRSKARARRAVMAERAATRP